GPPPMIQTWTFMRHLSRIREGPIFGFAFQSRNLARIALVHLDGRSILLHFSGIAPERRSGIQTRPDQPAAPASVETPIARR
ncbi:MAG: hypothetical protein E6614_20390, partial [Bradyrhizobium sp.]|nr:hypothetical protein [Bradyrhizobium sp.]